VLPSSAVLIQQPGRHFFFAKRLSFSNSQHSVQNTALRSGGNGVLSFSHVEQLKHDENRTAGCPRAHPHKTGGRILPARRRL
jgi:hypothetical protein